MCFIEIHWSHSSTVLITYPYEAVSYKNHVTDFKGKKWMSEVILFLKDGVDMSLVTLVKVMPVQGI